MAARLGRPGNGERSVPVGDDRRRNGSGPAREDRGPAADDRRRPLADGPANRECPAAGRPPRMDGRPGPTRDGPDDVAWSRLTSYESSPRTSNNSAAGGSSLST